jgi:hypothetical protein
MAEERWVKEEDWEKLIAAISSRYERSSDIPVDVIRAKIDLDVADAQIRAAAATERAALATERNAQYMLWSVIFAAVAALGSLASALLALLALLST